MSSKMGPVWWIVAFLVYGALAFVIFNIVLKIDDQAPGKKVTYEPLGIKTITCYHAITKECDSTPDIGAGGRVAKNGVPLGNFFTCNNLPFGTRIIIPGLTGGTVWTCRDRTADFVTLWNRKLKRQQTVFIGRRIDLLVPLGTNIGLRNEKVFLVKEEKWKT